MAAMLASKQGKLKKTQVNNGEFMHSKEIIPIKINKNEFCRNAFRGGTTNNYQLFLAAYATHNDMISFVKQITPSIESYLKYFLMFVRYKIPSFMGVGIVGSVSFSAV